MRPRRERLDQLTFAGRVIRKQPPVRIQVCQTPGRVPDFDGCPTCVDAETPMATCTRCGFAYCTQHLPYHIHGFSVPPDSWKSVRKRIWERAKQLAGDDADFRGSLWLDPTNNRRLDETRIAGILADPRPPVRIEYCNPPSSGHVEDACVHASKACHPDGHAVCDRCFYSYCPHHLQAHVRALILPRHAWKAIETSYRKQFQEARLRVGGRGILVRVPPLQRRR